MPPTRIVQVSPAVGVPPNVTVALEKSIGVDPSACVATVVRVMRSSEEPSCITPFTVGPLPLTPLRVKPALFWMSSSTPPPARSTTW